MINSPCEEMSANNIPQILFQCLGAQYCFTIINYLRIHSVVLLRFFLDEMVASEVSQKRFDI